MSGVSRNKRKVFVCKQTKMRESVRSGADEKSSKEFMSTGKSEYGQIVINIIYFSE
jgi:hypothetical protein